jgi:hypothetical protein
MCVLAALGLLLIAVPRAEAVEAFDGRIQAHGFLEMQIRSLSRDFEEELDLAQWYNVINVELEFDILPDGWGPFDLLQAYVRIEGRFDCLYYNACGIFPSAKTYGDKSRNLPLRLRDALDEDYAGVIESNDQATPSGDDKFRVPDDGKVARNPTDWVLFKETELPLTTIGQEQESRVDYDPLLDLTIIKPGKAKIIGVSQTKRKPISRNSPTISTRIATAIPSSIRMISLPTRRLAHSGSFITMRGPEITLRTWARGAPPAARRAGPPCKRRTRRIGTWSGTLPRQAGRDQSRRRRKTSRWPSAGRNRST